MYINATHPSTQPSISIRLFLNVSKNNYDILTLQPGRDFVLRIIFDVVTISYNKFLTPDLISFLTESGFVTISEKYLKKGHYRRHYDYQREPDRIEILSGKIPKGTFDPSRDLLKLHSPNNQLLAFIRTFFDLDNSTSIEERIGVTQCVSQVEVAFDFFFFSDQEDLQEHFSYYLRSILFLPYRRKPALSYENSTNGTKGFYSSARKHGKSSRFIRLYLHECYHRRRMDPCMSDQVGPVS